MDAIKDFISPISGILTLGVLVWSIFLKPSEKNEASIEVMEASCKAKHDRVDEKFGEIKQELSFINENHLKHIESDINEMKCSFARLEGILLGKEK